MQVRLKSVQYISVMGQLKPHYPGDWVDVSRQIAQRWLAEGSATIPGLDNAQAIAGGLEDCCLLVRGKIGQAKAITSSYWKLEAKVWDGKLTKKRNLIWNPSQVVLSPEQALVGLSRVEKTRPEYDAWEVAVMLMGKNSMAQHYGPENERKQTKKLVGDLRIPVYNTAALWVRNTSAVKRLLREWWAAVEAGEDERHAFLRVLYKVPVLLCTLPAGWVGIR
jgi:hypothetical protein